MPPSTALDQPEQAPRGRWLGTPALAGLQEPAYQLVSPEMPWSGGRLYDVPYGEGLAELHATVRQLRGNGAKRVVVGGESFGANGALAYQSRYGDADALIVLAPGHLPGGWYRSGITRAEVDRAGELFKEGKGRERFSFTDPNQERSRRMSATVESYLSYFRPNGLGNVSQSARTIAAERMPVPVLVVNSSNEVRSQGRAAIFDLLPPHPKNVYLESTACHGDAAEAARPDVVRFLESIAAE